MTDLEQDPIRQFALALPYRLRDALRLDYETYPVIRAAAEKVGPRDLATQVSKGITRAYANPWPLMWHRIRRAAGLLDPDPTERPTEEATN